MRSANVSASGETFGLVQALRGIAALWVVFFHATAAGDVAHNFLFDLGDNGVAIFFALSGFVIAHSIRGQEITPGYIGRFALRRSIRLDPALWASIALFIAFAFFSAKAKHQLFSAPSLAELVANITYTQVFLGLPSINTVYWTLTYEVQFYLVVVICVMAAQRRGSLVYLVPFALALIFGTHLLKSPVRGLFVDNWHCFFLGALAYWSYQRTEALIGFAVLGSAVILFNPSPFNLISTVTALGLMMARKTGHIRYSPKPLLFLGAISYSLYLTHNPIMGASFFITKKLALSQWAGLLIAVAACIAVSSAFWWLIERPTMALAKRIKMVRPKATLHPVAEPEYSR
jgi:peptidoglycan/LPS O-acetylase OafA/YrhL